MAVHRTGTLLWTQVMLSKLKPYLLAKLITTIPTTREMKWDSSIRNLRTWAISRSPSRINRMKMPWHIVIPLTLSMICMKLETRECQPLVLGRTSQTALWPRKLVKMVFWEKMELLTMSKWPKTNFKILKIRVIKIWCIWGIIREFKSNSAILIKPKIDLNRDRVRTWLVWWSLLQLLRLDHQIINWTWKFLLTTNKTSCHNYWFQRLSANTMDRIPKYSWIITKVIITQTIVETLATSIDRACVFKNFKIYTSKPTTDSPADGLKLSQLRK